MWKTLECFAFLLSATAAIAALGIGVAAVTGLPFLFGGLTTGGIVYAGLKIALSYEGEID